MTTGHTTAFDQTMAKLLAGCFITLSILCFTEFSFAEIEKEANGTEILIQSGHALPINAVVYSPSDGRYVVSSSDDQTLRVWDARNGTLIRILKDHKKKVKALSFSPDGRYLASVSDEAVCLWDFRAFKIKRVFFADVVAPTKSAAFSNEGRYLAIAVGKKIRIWDMLGQIYIKVFSGHTDTVNFITFSPDGKYLASGSDDHTVRLWNAKTGELVRTYTQDNMLVFGIAFSPDGRFLAAGGAYKFLLMWEVETGRLVYSFKGHTFFITSVSFHPNGQYLGSGSRDGTIRVWNIETGESLRLFREGRVNTIAFSPDGQEIASGGDAKRVALWDVQNDRFRSALGGWNELARSIAISPKGSILASGNVNGSVRLWDLKSGTSIRTIKGHKEAIDSVSFSPDGVYLASVSFDSLKLWNAHTGQLTRIFEQAWGSCLDKPCTRLAFSPDGRYIASEGGIVTDKQELVHTVRIWSVQTGKIIRDYTGLPGSPDAIAYSLNGKYLAASDGLRINLWHVGSNTPIYSLDQRPGVVCLAFSPDGRHIVAGTDNGEVKLFEALTGKTLLSFEGHGHEVTGIGFNSNGSMIISAGMDETVRIFETQSGKSVRLMRTESNNIALARDPESGLLASAGTDGIVKVWEADTGKRLVTLVGFSDDEWVSYTRDNSYLISPKGDKYVTPPRKITTPQ